MPELNADFDVLLVGYSKKTSRKQQGTTVAAKCTKAAYAILRAYSLPLA